MNVLYSGLYLIAVLGLLLTSVVVGEDPPCTTRLV